MFGVMASFFPFELLRKVEDPGSYTIRSHGAALARVHLYDWLLLLLLIASVAVLNIIEPFHRFVGKDMMTDLKFPLKPNTIPTWSVPLYAVALPIIIFGLFYLKRRNVFDLHQAILGILYSVLITGVITDSIKDGVGRPRPNFFWRCFPDGNAVFDQLGDVVCHGIDDIVKEGYKSFPSGHSSWSFAGLGFLSLYLAGKIKAFDKRGQIRKLCVVILPILAAAMVAVSRVDDYWHHWQDVFAGALIGWCPHAYFRTLEETCTNNVQPDEYHHKVEINGRSSLLQAT